MEQLSEQDARGYLDYIIEEAKNTEPLNEALAVYFKTEDINVLDEAAQRNNCLSIYTWLKAKTINDFLF